MKHISEIYMGKNFNYNLVSSTEELFWSQYISRKTGMQLVGHNTKKIYHFVELAQYCRKNHKVNAYNICKPSLCPPEEMRFVKHYRSRKSASASNSSTGYCIKCLCYYHADTFCYQRHNNKYKSRHSLELEVKREPYSMTLFQENMVRQDGISIKDEVLRFCKRSWIVYCSSFCNSPDPNISRTISHPPINSPPI